jgi:amino-acid N-acetyltransferase
MTRNAQATPNNSAQPETGAPHIGIRPAQSTDLPAIEALLVKNDLPTIGVADALGGFFVAEAGGSIVGVVGVETCCDQYGLLRSTAVDSAWRSHGVGRRLVERAVAESEARGFQALYLLTTTAERYFPSFGFKATSREAVPDEVKATAEFKDACPASATVMALHLPAAQS